MEQERIGMERTAVAEHARFKETEINNEYNRRANMSMMSTYGRDREQIRRLRKERAVAAKTNRACKKK